MTICLAKNWSKDGGHLLREKNFDLHKRATRPPEVSRRDQTSVVFPKFERHFGKIIIISTKLCYSLKVVLSFTVRIIIILYFCLSPQWTEWAVPSRLLVRLLAPEKSPPPEESLLRAQESLVPVGLPDQLAESQSPGLPKKLRIRQPKRLPTPVDLIVCRSVTTYDPLTR